MQKKIKKNQPCKTHFLILKNEFQQFKSVNIDKSLGRICSRILQNLKHRATCIMIFNQIDNWFCDRLPSFDE